ncbi:MAG: Ig-like domain-containing protein [bacterium]
MKNLVLRLSLSCLLIIITTMSYAGTYLPILTWTGTGTYKSDGLDPEVGVDGTTFTFRVKYIDYDNEAPAGDVIVCLVNDSVEGFEDTGMGFAMSPEDTSRDYRKGVIYRYATSTLTAASYPYYFKVTDNQQQDMRINIAERSGANGATLLEPQETDRLSMPVTGTLTVATDQILDWVGSGKYEHDGLYPENGGTNTVFTYKVKYFGITEPAQGYPKVVITNSYADEFSVIMQSETGGSYLNGKVYYYATSTLQPDDLYTYRFARTETDGTPAIDGPEIYPNDKGSAFLDWTGEPGYENDGVKPDIASYGSTFTYQIKYVNVDGTPPDAGYPQISLAGDSDSHQMDLVSGTSASGAIYQYQGTYPYPEGIVAGTVEISLDNGSTILSTNINPCVVNIPPILTWAGGTGYADDGVEPNVGTAGTKFTFRIKYTDPENDTPQGIALKVDDTPVAMTSVGNGIYECTGTFSLGEHSYCFYAIDSQNMDAAGSETVVGASAITGIPPQLATFTVSIGSLTSVTITGTDVVGIEESATLTAHAANELNMEIGDSDVDYLWEIIEGTGTIISGTYSKTVTIKAGTNTGTLTLSIIASPSANSTLQGEYVYGTKTITIKPGKPQALFFSDTNTNTTTANLPVGSSTGFVVSGRDSYGNVAAVADCNWQVQGMIGSLSTSTGNSVIFTAGTATGTGTIVVSTMSVDGTLTATVSITVIAGTFHHFDISMNGSTVAIDGSMTITLTPRDASGNTFSNGVSSPELKVTVGTTSVSLGTCAINTPVEFLCPQELRNNLGTSTVYALINGGRVGTSSPFQVVSGSPHHFRIISPATNTAVLAGDSITITAQLEDTYNNSVLVGTTACVIFQSDSFGTFTVGSTSSTAAGTITIQTNANGQIAGIYQPNLLAGSKAILVGMFLASDEGVSGTSGAIILTIPAVLITLIAIAPATFTAGVSDTMSIMARDGYGNPATATITLSGSLGTITPTGCVIGGGIVDGFSWQGGGTWTGTVSFTKAQLQAVLNITAQNGKATTATFTVLPAAPHNLQPTTATSYNGSCGSTWTFGVGLSDVYGNPIEGQKIVCELISNPSNATLSATTVDTDQLGMASNTLTIGTKTGTYTVKAYLYGFPDLSATFTATTIVGSPTLSAGNYPSVATVSSKVILEAILKDDSGNPFMGKTIQWQILSSPSDVVISPLTSTTNNQGIATTSLTLGTKTGVYTVKAQFGTLIATFTITATPDELSAMNTAIVPGTVAVVNSPVELRVGLSDPWGNPAATTTVNWQSQGLAIATNTQTINSTATLGFTLGTKTGMYIVTAAVGTLTATFTITALPGEPAAINTFITPGTTAVVNSQIVLSAGLADQWGNPAATATVSWKQQGMATTTTQTINGTATLGFTLGTKTGVYIVTATVGTLTTTFTITATPGTPSLSQNFTIGSQTVCSSIPLEVSLRDEFGNTCSGTVEWSLIDPLPLAASISATSTTIDQQTGSAGITLTLGTKTGDYRVRAQVDGYTATFTITAEAGAVGTMMTGYVPATAKVNTTLPLTVGLYDSYGNPVTAAVDWQTQELATFTQTIDGTATLSFTLGTHIGTYEITASHEGRIATFTITATPGTPSLSQNFATASRTVKNEVIIEVALRDRFGNPCLGAVEWGLIDPLPATASLSAASTTINPQGSSSITLTLGTKTGEYIVRAQVGTLTATFTITAEAGAVETMLPGYLPATAKVNTILPLTIGLYDSYGNPVTATVDWQSQGLATITQTINGTATLSFTLGTHTGTYEITASHGGRTATLTITATPDTPLLSQNFTAGSQTVCSSVLLEVFLRDKFDNPCVGTVSWNLIDPLPATASLSAVSTTINPQGSAGITLTLGTKIGDYRVRAQVDGYMATFTINVKSDNPAASTSSGTFTGTAVVGGTMTFTVSLYDTYGNIVQEGSVNWTITRGATTTATATTPVSNTGEAAFSCKMSQIAGTYTIIARFGAALLKSFSVRVNHGSPILLSNSSTLAAKSYLPGASITMEVSFKDEFGNPCVGTVSWSLVDPLPLAASLSATSTIIGTQTGTANITLTLGTKTGDYRVRAQVEGYSATFTINVKSDNPATSTSSGTFTGTTVVGGTMTFTVSLYDAYGNIVNEGSVNWTITRGTITTATNTTTVSNGKAEFSCKMSQIAGTYTIIARFGAALLKSFSVRVNHGSPILLSNSSTLAAKSYLPGESITMEVSFKDEFGNPCVGTVAWSLVDPLPLAASLSATSTIIGTQTGTASVTLTLGTIPGIYMVKAAINEQEATFTITIQTISVSDELLIYPNPIRVQEWDRYTYGDPWIKFGKFNENEQVTIRVYDISGNLIWMMENASMEQGFVQWDMKNSSGIEISSGVYLCITTDNRGKRIGRFAVIR